MASSNPRTRTPTFRTAEGAPARSIDDEAQLRRTVMCCLLNEKTFYEEGVSVKDRIREIIHRAKYISPICDLALEARDKMHLRHTPLFMMLCVFNRPDWAKLDEFERGYAGRMLGHIIQRPDEMGEFLAMWWEGPDKRVSETRKLPRQVINGLARAFPKFDAYQLAKYDRPHGISLLDVMRLVHPRPRDTHQALIWDDFTAGKLPPAITWEHLLSEGKDKKTSWLRLLQEGRLGGVAFLRNLRNMREVGVPEEVMSDYIETQPKAFRRILPFRWITAAKFAPTLEPYLELGMFRSLEGLVLRGNTALVVDHSGSMLNRISEKSENTRFDAACGLAMLFREVCERVSIWAFSQPLGADEKEKFYRRYGRDANLDQIQVQTKDGLSRPLQANKPAIALVPPRRGFALRDSLEQATPWWGTDTEAAKKAADARGYDRIIIVTDEQSETPLTAPQGTGYVINVGTYQHGIGYGKWTHIDGWSDSVVHYMMAAEGGIDGGGDGLELEDDE